MANSPRKASSASGLGFKEATGGEFRVCRASIRLLGSYNGNNPPENVLNPKPLNPQTPKSGRNKAPGLGLGSWCSVSA